MSDDASPKPCSVRLDSGMWCVLPPSHDGGHVGPAPRFGPFYPAPDRHLMAKFRAEVAEKWDTKPGRDGVEPAERWLARVEGRPVR